MSYQLQQRGRASIDFLVSLRRESNALEELPSAAGVAIDEAFAHRRHQGRGGKLGASMETEKGDHAEFALELGDVDVEIHPIDALQLQRHMLIDDFCDGFW